MKAVSCLSLVLCLATTATHSKENHTQKLAVQTSTAEAAHLTTRIQWLKFPQVKFSDVDLNARDRYAIVRVKANEAGKVINATVQESTGLKSLDDKLIQAVLNAKVKPQEKNGNRLAVVGYQTFNLMLTQDKNEQCHFNFSSKTWLAQKNNDKTAFHYQSQPQLNVDLDDLGDFSRTVKFAFKADKQGNVKKAKITQGSGRYELDQKVLEALQATTVEVPRKYWVYKKSHLKDEIQFKLDECNK